MTAGPSGSVLQPAAICAVVTVTYPDGDVPARVARVRDQVGLVVIVDDGASAENVRLLTDWFGRMAGVLVHHRATNGGVAAALNDGVRLAREAGYRWVLLLDDDTGVAPDMVARLVDAWRALATAPGRPVALISLAWRDPRTGEPEPGTTNGRPFLEKRGIITSGSLVPLDVYERLGPLREEFFLDGIDYDYCLRARGAGYRVVKVCQVGMDHTIGAKTRHRVAGLTFETNNHKPLRRYYAYRNFTVLVREHLLDDPLFALAALAYNTLGLGTLLLFERDRWAKLRMALVGIADGLRGRLGKWNAQRAPSWT